MAYNNKNKKEKIEEPRINDEIYGYDTCRVVYRKSKEEKSDEDINEVMSLREAKKLSDKMDLDLIEINRNANPPILKLANYSKYLYELKKEMKNKTKVVSELKEIQLSTNISQHDLEIKANKAKEFIADGHKVKVVLTMKRRELTRLQESEKAIYKFIELMLDCASCESVPKTEGTKCVVILKKKK